MPRCNRQFEIGGIYHVLNRGVEKRKIFSKDQDYQRFIIALEFFNSPGPINLWTLLLGTSTAIAGTVPTIGERLAAQRAKKKGCVVDILAFALMPNHYHLILRETQEGGISTFMRKMGGYSTYFNKQYGRIGPLFQSRYKAVSVKTDEQLSVLFAYVHTNPVELVESLWKKKNKVRDVQKVAKLLAQYRWSSYPDYIGNQNFPNVVQKDFFLERFGGSKACEKVVREWIAHKAEQTKIDQKDFE